MIKLILDLIAEGKIEKALSAWCSPAFPVAKKTPGAYRIVIDYRKVNDATVTDAEPLPRIEHILANQGKYKIWSVLDLKDGFHQIPIRPECRHITCMSTPVGVFQWKVLPMGLKNASAIFQRVMESVLQEHDYVNVYIDDIIVGSSGDTEAELVANHEKNLRAVLKTLAENDILVSPKKAQLFMKQVEFCGHVLTENRRFPAPGKLLALQKWELPQTITQLRGF